MLRSKVLNIKAASTLRFGPTVQALQPWTQLRLKSDAPKPKASSSHDFSQTLNLPQTEFPMRANAVEREPKLQEKCSTFAYQWQKENNTGTDFVIHDGPPYANGRLHMGHALNKILKDVINRYKLLRGHKINFVPGWDCHGLPIELKAISENEAAKKSIPPVEIRRRAKEFALSAVADQKSDFVRWGVMGNWEDPYLTLDKKYEARQLEVFWDMVEQGYIYRGLRPIYWSPSTRTALAEAELEYPEDHVSKATYVAFKVRTNHGHLGSFENLHAVIWTTTPWTLPANMAICYHQELEYCVAKDPKDGKHLLVLKELLQSVQEKCARALEVVSVFKGSDLENHVCTNPLNGRDSPLIHGAHVMSGTGTGLVHTAPGHGADDFNVAKQYGIPVLCPVDDHGRFTAEAGSNFEGLEVLGAGTTAVIEELKNNGSLLVLENYAHKYPYDWRSKKPVITRTTKQWFADLSDLQSSAIAALKDVTMVPPAGRARLESFLEGRQGWCISRQRSWGVPIPVFYDKETNKHLLTKESVSHVAQLVSQHGCDCWWTMSVEELLHPMYRNNGREYIKGTDTLDVWFDSGVSWASVLQARGLKFPADVYLEGSDQHRGWFQSSLLTATAVARTSPYRTLITHGFVLDENGRKMSKSLGNTIEPSFIINGGKNQKQDPAYGADVLRAWVSSTDYSKDVLIGPTVLTKITETVRKIRNTARYLLGNLHDFNPASDSDSAPPAPLLLVDRYMLHRLHVFVSTVTQSYETYSFSKVYQALANFVALDLSAFYFEVSKDRLYAEAKDSPSRRACQYVLSKVLEALMKTSAPVLCHTSEDIYQHYNAKTQESVFCTGWMDMPAEWNQPSLEAEMSRLVFLRDETNKLLESARKDRVIGSSLEAQASISIDQAHPLGPSLLSSLRSMGTQEISDFFGTSHVDLVDGGEITVDAASKSYREVILIKNEKGEETPVIIVVQKASKHKCPRCWKYSAEKENDLCSRCETVVPSAKQ